MTCGIINPLSSNLVIFILLLLPLVLVAFAWNKTKTPLIALVILTFSNLLLDSAGLRSVKWVVFGADYSRRLFITIGLNLLLAFVVGIYLVIKRRWIAAAAAIILTLDWIILGSLNTVV